MCDIVATANITLISGIRAQGGNGSRASGSGPSCRVQRDYLDGEFSFAGSVVFWESLVVLANLLSTFASPRFFHSSFSMRPLEVRASSQQTFSGFTSLSSLIHTTIKIISAQVSAGCRGAAVLLQTSHV